MNIKYGLIAVLWLLTFQLFGQQYHFDNYSVKEGLAQSSVYTIEQDNKGFLWLGTASGLSRFNGGEFVNYSTENGLADGAVKVIHIDSLGVIWLGHVDGGVSRFSNGEINVVLSMGADITSFQEDDKGNLWVASFGKGVIKIENPYEKDKEKLKFKQYKGQEGLSDVVFQVKHLEDGNIYFVTDVGVKHYDYQKNTFKFYRVPNMPTYFQITYMFESIDGDQWFGSYNGGLYHYKKKSGQLKIYDIRDGLASNWISTINDDEKGNVWVGTWGGGLSVIKDSKVLTINKNNGLKDEHIRCIKEDREGNILFGTKETGLLVYKGSQFVYYGLNDRLADEQVWAILKDDKGNDWIGTNGGISVFNNGTLVNSYSEGDGLPYQQVRYIKSDKKGKIWIGTWGGGVMEFNPAANRFEMTYRVNSFMNQLLITAMSIDDDNNLWVGTTDGLVYYEIDNQLSNRLTQSHGLSGNEITTIFTDSKNVVWVGSRGRGLNKIKGDKIENVDLKAKITASSIIEDDKGNLWIGTEGKGILVFNGDSVIKKYGLNNGLLSDYISLLNIDDDGNMWIGTNKGLNKYDVKKNQFYSYSEKMGYVGIESKPNATYKDFEGNLWFGTIKGAVKFNKKEERLNGLEPITQITGFSVNMESRTMKEGLELSYKEKSIIFNYSSICLTNPEEVYYKVKLEPLDEDWKPATQQTYVSYSPLPPGEYTFMVKACNNSGVWNVEPITYSFEIIPPIWQRTWFIILIFVVLIISIFGVIKYREKQLIKEKKVLEDKVEERTQEVVHQSKELERKNKDIIDSITYAKRIQDAILPSNDAFTKALSQTFILFNPKDIVSGDFYWLAVKDEKSLFAAVDCTGHGVPGAFMSIVGHNLLNKIVGEYGIVQPAKILDELNKGVASTLENDEGSEGIRDGMDIALCCFDKKKRTIEYAGAYNSLYIASKEDLSSDTIKLTADNDGGIKLFEVKANRFPIGNYSEETKKFTNHTIHLNEGDTVYLFSDGYADQFGGVNGKKYRYKRFKELLLSINNLSMDEQKRLLEKEFSDWMGNHEQIDDVIIIGSRL
ncbi:MAG: two-component regulator propeller domain-containing protein [Vicingaceae bacterium]|nr:two-component regulator propeller domain-containing protein [Vicingaceae bacterium]